MQGYHLDLSTGACGAVLRSCCSNLFTLSYGTATRSRSVWTLLSQVTDLVTVHK